MSLAEQRARAAVLGERAVQTWGVEAQVDIVLEELAELQVALLHYRRRRASWRDVLGEVADVEVTLAGLRVVLQASDGDLAVMMKAKLDRLEQRLAEPALHYGGPQL